MASQQLALLARLYLGVILCVAAAGKLLRPVDFTDTMNGFLGHVTAREGFPWYAAFVHAVVLPHAALFATLVLLGESCAGIGLLFGLCTRLSASLAVFLLLNYLCAKGAAPWSPGSNDMADIVLAAIVLLGNGGRTFGLDRSLHERFPRVAVF